MRTRTETYRKINEKTEYSASQVERALDEVLPQGPIIGLLLNATDAPDDRSSLEQEIFSCSRDYVSAKTAAGGAIEDRAEVIDRVLDIESVDALLLKIASGILPAQSKLESLIQEAVFEKIEEEKQEGDRLL